MTTDEKTLDKPRQLGKSRAFLPDVDRLIGW
jgi:hypothetical protein